MSARAGARAAAADAATSADGDGGWSTGHVVVERFERAPDWARPMERRTIVANTFSGSALGLCGVVAAGLSMRRLVVALFTLRARALTPLLLRRLARWVRTLHYSDEQFFDADGAGEALVARRRQGLDRLSGALRAQYRGLGRLGRGDCAKASRTFGSPTPTACRFRSRRSCASASISARSSPRRTARDCSTSTDTGRSTSSGSYGVNVAGFDRYKDWMARGLERTSGPRPGARAAASGGRREHRAAQADLRARRGVVPHERHRGGDGRGAAGPLQHPAQAHRVLLGRVPRLVGRRAARARQRARASTTASR